MSPTILVPGAKVSGAPVTISGGAVFVSGIVTVTSGSYINIGSGIGVTLASGHGLAVYQSGLTLNLATNSGLAINIGSGVGVTLNSGLGLAIAISGLAPYIFVSGGMLGVSHSGAAIISNLPGNSGQWVNIGSGTGVLIQSGINVNIGSGIGVTLNSGLGLGIAMSGATTIVRSGLGVTVATSGQGYPVVGGQYRPYNSVAASGVNTPLLTDTLGATVVAGVYRPIEPTVSSGQYSVLAVGFDGDLKTAARTQSGDAIYVRTSGAVNIVTVSGQVAILSGSYVNIGSGIGIVQASGAYVIMSGQGVIVASGVNVIISGQAVFISGTVNILSGAYVNIGSNTVVSIGSGISYQMSGANVIATVSVGSGLGVLATTSGQGFPAIGGINRVINSGGNVVLASGIIAIPSLDVNGNLVVMTSGQTANMLSGQALYVQMSGVNATISGQWVNFASSLMVSVGSGISYQMSGANVIATVSVGSGLGVLATTSGQGFPAIGGINRVINSGGNIVLASGVIAIPSLDVNGNLVVKTSGQTANMLSGQALYVQMSGVNTTMSGLWVNFGSSLMVSIGSGISYQMSGTNVIATVSVGSGLGTLVTTSGQNYPVMGGQYRPQTNLGTFLASGINSIVGLDIYGNQVVAGAYQNGPITLTSGQYGPIRVGAGGEVIVAGQSRPVDLSTNSGQWVTLATDAVGRLIVATSGQGFPAIGGINRAINSGGNQIFASGVIVIPSTDSNGNLVVRTSGQTANMISGQALYIQQSGVNATVSGRYILALPLGAGAVTASTFIVNTSAVQLPNTSGREHILQIMDSGVYWIGGVNTTKSGLGFQWLGIPGTDPRSQLTLKIANLNLLYMASQAVSGKISIISMN
jgi:hypothetical protein